MNAGKFCNLLRENDLEFITGVPGRALRGFSEYLEKNETVHLIAGDEGQACGFASGYHFATGRVPVVYLCHSRLGNCVNILANLMSEQVSRVPVLLLISGVEEVATPNGGLENGVSDTPRALLNILSIPHEQVVDDEAIVRDILLKSQMHFDTRSSPFALICPNSFLASSVHATEPAERHPLTREKVVETLLEILAPRDVVVATGPVSFEMVRRAERLPEERAPNVLNVDSNGCAGSIALGIALSKPGQRVILVDDEDGPFLKLENIASIGHHSPKNLLHLLLDERTAEPLDGEKTMNRLMRYDSVSLACNYENADRVYNAEYLKDIIKKNRPGPSVVIIQTVESRTPQPGQQFTNHSEQKESFMTFIGARNGHLVNLS